jgi:four helix bundle protein
MAKFNNIEEIEAWQKARAIANAIYRISKNGDFSKDFALKNQIRKAAISIPSNIAEGFERNGNKEFINFLSIAKGSIGEVKTQLYIASDQGYIEEIEFKNTIVALGELSRMVGGLMNYLNRSTMKGNKFFKGTFKPIDESEIHDRQLGTLNPELGTDKS